MGVTIKYGGKFHNQRPLAELRRELETLAIDAARRWSAFLGLDEPELEVYQEHGGGALIDFVNSGAESFNLWRPTTASNPEAEEYNDGGEILYEFPEHDEIIQDLYIRSGKTQTTLYNMLYLNEARNLFHKKDILKIHLSTNKPLIVECNTAEGKEIRFILAPRVERR